MENTILYNENGFIRSRDNKSLIKHPGFCGYRFKLQKRVFTSQAYLFTDNNRNNNTQDNTFHEAQAHIQSQAQSQSLDYIKQ